jgi:DNA-binding MarR family transcriptional regulator
MHTMTDSVYGFFGPEERSLANRSADPDLALRVLRLVAVGGAATMSALLGELDAPARAVVAAVDKLEASGLVTVDAGDREEVVHPTEAGLRAAAG